MSQGATVRCIVTNQVIGPALHNFEYHPQVFLMSRFPSSVPEAEEWVLRSDVFPSRWNGRYVNIHFAKDGAVSFKCSNQRILLERRQEKATR